MKLYRKTWRHEMVIKAKSRQQAQEIWESTNLGELRQAIKDKQILSHEFIELVSSEKID